MVVRLVRAPADAFAGASYGDSYGGMATAIRGIRPARSGTRSTAPGPRRGVRDMTEPTSFDEFWPYYVSQHRDATCRRLHFIGTSLALGCLAVAPVAPVRLAAVVVASRGSVTLRSRRTGPHRGAARRRSRGRCAAICGCGARCSRVRWMPRLARRSRWSPRSPRRIATRSAAACCTSRTQGRPRRSSESRSSSSCTARGCRAVLVRAGRESHHAFPTHEPVHGKPTSGRSAHCLVA